MVLCAASVQAAAGDKDWGGLWAEVGVRSSHMERTDGRAGERRAQF